MLQVRQGVFETNSSSTHSITICTEGEFERWKNGELGFNKDAEEFVVPVREELTDEQKQEVEDHYRYMYKEYGREYYNWDSFDEEAKEEAYEEYYEYVVTYEEFMENDWFETYEVYHTTENGDKIVAFGYYGHD